MYLNSGDEEESSKSVYKSAKEKKRRRKEKECRVLLHFCSLIRHKCKRSFTWSQMLSFTNVLLHASCTAAYVGEEAEQQLYTELQGSVVILFFPPLFKAIFRTQAHLSNTATLLQKTKYFKGGSCLRMLFFFFSRVQLLGKGKKTLIIVLCLKFIPFLLLASL